MKRIAATRAQRAAMLRSCSLFSELPDNELTLVSKDVTVREYDRAETVFRAGTPAIGFHVIVTGQVKIFRISPDGREQVLHIYGPGSACGEAAMFQGSDYPASMATLRKTRTVFIERTAFIRCARESPEIMMRLLAILSRRLREFVRLVDDLSLKEVSGRLAQFLLDAAKVGNEPNTVRLESSKTVLASRLGTIPETLSRTLKKFQDGGLIAMSGRTIHLLDIPGLSEIVPDTR